MVKNERLFFCFESAIIIIMTGKEFMNRIVNKKADFFEKFLNTLKKEDISFCVIGGLAVNAYAEPVVSLDLDIVVICSQVDRLVSILQKIFSVKKYPNSTNVSYPSSDLRIQIQNDPRYQPFIERAVYKNVLGYNIPVATIKDVLQGKIWAAMDESRRPSKRQKDLADIMRLIETDQTLISILPVELKKRLYP